MSRGDLVTIQRTLTIDAHADVVWATIRNFGSVASYFPSVLDCVVDGSGVGSRRHIRTDIGGTHVSELVELDDESMSMGYRVIESTVPIDDYSSRMVVSAQADTCVVDYASTYRTRPGFEGDDVRTFLAHQLESALESLQRLHGRATPKSTPEDSS